MISEVYHISYKSLQFESSKIENKNKLISEFDKILNEYIVKKGDTLTKIVMKKLNRLGVVLDNNELNSLIKKIAKENNITNPDLIYPGQKIFINVKNLPTKYFYPVNGIISSKYGIRFDPFTKKIKFHKGIDIAAPIGSPVKSVVDGKVIFSGWIKGYGKVVIIKHNNIITKYAHNSELLVKKGDIVKKGQIIAKVGSSGRSTGPHLHFEVVIDNRHIDPLKFLQS